ncbi:PepSY domain-containing protein [Rhodobacter capsulatus]|uniref:PepSY domain-containing protein n=1 Tax=Rhodobacter capsulatus TaxID=1061 RepID=UPI0006DC2BB9|nr:PepSY domain-containing protein [Rhodobacter capsulatus]KQB12907.1 hypothetical protein AP071_05775 [Rhodobacter capsulatus]KQB13165.1 hypothetical protein AP073_05005 [Rhodobacter capsulatus]PZX28490.1 hypothetical protein LY44_00236 [Rhodobacter capsulatus]QNR62768.1 PepSY domain-containing protein [Rhodobacter capsulatus]
MTAFRFLSAFAALAVLAQAPAAAAHDNDCTVPMADWQPREAVRALVEQQGLTVRRIKIDDGCYEVDARDGTGARVRMRLDPGSLQILRRGDDDDDDHHRRRGDDHDDKDRSSHHDD